jgi:hypothetical protein
MQRCTGTKLNVPIAVLAAGPIIFLYENTLRPARCCVNREGELTLFWLRVRQIRRLACTDVRPVSVWLHMTVSRARRMLLCYVSVEMLASPVTPRTSNIMAFQLLGQPVLQPHHRVHYSQVTCMKAGEPATHLPSRTHHWSGDQR